MLYDISVTVEPEMARWPESPKIEIIPRKRMVNGDSSNASSIHMSVHTGTHMDSPFHFLDNGCGIDEIPVDLFIGPARVFEFSKVDSIGEEELKDLDLNGVARALFKTKNSSFWSEREFRQDFVYFTPRGATYLASKGVKLVGIDYLSVAAYGKEQVPTHLAFLKKGVAILEGINLSGIRPGDYEIICLPIKLKGCDGAPARALLRNL